MQNHIGWADSRFSESRKDEVPLWLHLVYGHENDRPRSALAARILAERPDLGQGELFLACAIGEETTVREMVRDNPSCVNLLESPWICPSCQNPLAMPPLVAVTHSGLLQVPEFRERLCRCAGILLDAGADPNQSWSHQAGGHPLSALYGAAGKNHDPELTKMLLDRGANPNDNESLYHATETPDLTCMRMLLGSGARVEGTNAVHHILDRDDLDGLKLLLAFVKDINALTSTIGSADLGDPASSVSRACRGFAGGRSRCSCHNPRRCFCLSLRTAEWIAGGRRGLGPGRSRPCFGRNPEHRRCSLPCARVPMNQRLNGLLPSGPIYSDHFQIRS